MGRISEPWPLRLRRGLVRRGNSVCRFAVDSAFLFAGLKAVLYCTWEKHNLPVRHFWGTDFPMKHFSGCLEGKLGEGNHVALHLSSGDFTPEGVHRCTERPFPDRGSQHLFSRQLPRSPWWLYLPPYQLATCFLDVPTQWVKSKLPSDGNTAPRQSSAT